MAEQAPATEDTIGLDYIALRDDGIGMLQHLCGELWTDYNVHDPGVTTLELLAYALSDLGFRTDFDMADYLTCADGSIDFARNALFEPAAILSCEALTINDYRRLLYDAVPGVAEIWVRRLDGGLLAIDVMAHPEGAADAMDGEELLDAVRRAFASHRNLGQDVDNVRLITPRPCYLRGEIDTFGERSAAEILAQILFDCDDYISSGMAVRRLRDVVHQGASPDQIFEGPHMRHGYVTASDAGERGNYINVSELIGVIQKIEGVRRVRTLTVVDEAGVAHPDLNCDSSQGHYPCFPFPADDAHMEQLRLQPEQGIEYGVSEQMLPSAAAWRARNRAMYEEGALEFYKLHFERQAFRTEAPASDSCYPLPAGRHRDLAAYYTIQDDYPEVYGINRYGLPADAGAQRLAQARQLKAYLFPFEQLMANYLQNLQAIPRLFSVAPFQPRATYGWQALDGSTISRIDELYASGPESRRDAMQQALARQDNDIERKGRLYDYLLALYGEAFPQTALRRFTHYHTRDAEAWLLEAKRRYIVALPELGGGRGRGCDYLQTGAAGCLSLLQRRCAILLGFDDQAPSLLPVWDGQQLELDDDSATPDEAPAPQNLHALDAAPGLQALAPRLPMPAGGYSESAFANGASLNNYRIGAAGGSAALYCRSARGWLILGDYGDTPSAIGAAHASAAALAAINRRCEGMHLIEHVLLRPRGAERSAAQAIPPAYFEARISVVLPRWTLRCADSDFRNFVEETVREHCPAHLHASFLWLSPALMAQFEALQTNWRAALREGEPVLLDAASAALAGFMRAHKADPA